MEPCLIKKNYTQPHNWVKMYGSEGLGLPLVGAGSFAADMLRFTRQKTTQNHTHPGNHILFVVEGRGFLEFAGKRHELTKGDCYFVPGNVSHKVGATDDSELYLLSAADDHRPVDSQERLEIV